MAILPETEAFKKGACPNFVIAVMYDIYSLTVTDPVIEQQYLTKEIGEYLG